jgi:RNA-directed DNA polymerase
MMHDHGKSDRPIVPAKVPNEAEPGKAKEALEGEGLAKGNAPERNVSRTQSRSSMSNALERIRQAARRDKRQRFTALLHHVGSVDSLKAAYFGLKRDAAAGVDGATWRQYGEGLESHLKDLSERIQRGAYRAQPVRRAYIPKAGEPGKARPLGVLVLEDKIVQRATAEVLRSLYEQDFVRFSYGFRPGKSPHQALDALSVGIMRRKVNWVLDADIRGFFDTLDHEWLVKFVEHRVADRRIVRLIQKWLNAGVLEQGKHIDIEMGTIQGGGKRKRTGM